MPMCALYISHQIFPALAEAKLHSMLHGRIICKQALLMAHALWRSTKAIVWICHFAYM